MSNEIAQARKNEAILAFVALAGMLFWFCDEMILSGKIPFFRDLTTYFYPIKFRVAESFKAGELPLWDPHMAAGFPLMAGFQSAVFYPPTFVYGLLPFFAAIQFTFVFHYVIAVSGSYVLLRSWSYPTFIAVIGAILFAFGGTTVSLTNLLNHFQSAVWLPWVIYSAERAVLNSRWRDILVFSIISLCQLLAGSPEMFLLSMALVVINSFRIRRQQQIHGYPRALGILLVSALIIIGLGMAQLLPTAELISQSRRDHAIPASEALAWSMQPSSLLGLLLPTLEADASTFLGVRLLLAEGVPFLLSHYMSVIAIFALCAWMAAAQMRERLSLGGLIVFSLLCAFGSHTPIYPLLYEWVPFARVIRFPEKFYFLTFALLILTAVRGIRALVDDKRFRSNCRIASALVGGWVIAYVAFRWNPNLMIHWILPSQPGHTPPPIDPTTIATIFFGLEKQIAVASILTGVLVLNHFKLLRSSLLQSLLVIVVFADLSIANKPLHFLRDQEIIEKAARILPSPPPKPSRIFYHPPGSNLHPSFVSVNGNPSFEKATEIALNNILPNAGLLYGFEYFQDIDALGRQSYTNFLNFINMLPPNQRGNLLRVLNVKHVVAFRTLEIKGLRLVGDFPEHYSKLYEVTDPVPRTYLASRAIFEPNSDSALRRMSSDGFNPLKEVIVDTPVHEAISASGQGQTTITRYQNNKVEIAASLSHPGILVLTDSFYPGWKVLVDGKEQRLLRANYFFRAVELPAGEHQVEFVYDPLPVRVGYGVSLLTAGLLGTVSLFRIFRRKRRLAGEANPISYEPAGVS